MTWVNIPTFHTMFTVDLVLDLQGREGGEVGGSGKKRSKKGKRQERRKGRFFSHEDRGGK